MNFFFILAALFASPAYSIDLKDLGVKIDTNPKKANPHLELKSNQIVGTCDGKTYTDQADFDGCERIVHARYPRSYQIANPTLPSQSKPVPTTEEKP